MAMADEQEETEQSKRVGFDFDAFAYVADKGPLTAFGLEGENVDTFWYHSLRIMGMKKGYSCCAGVPGFYLVNKANAPVDTSSVCHTLPALLHPADEGQPAVYGLRFKVAPNGNIYVMCIPTDVKQSSDKDGVDKWLGEKDVTPRRLNLFSSIEPIENRDGNPLAKKFDVWLKNHSTYFAELKLKSLAATRAWLHQSCFSRNFMVVQRNAEAAIRASVKQSTGTAEGGGKGKKKSNAAKEVDPATSLEINRRTALLNSVVQPLQAYVQRVAVSLGHRIIELDLAAEDCTGDITPEKLTELLKKASPLRFEALLEVIKTSDKIALLQKGEASIASQSSPLPTPVKPAGQPTPAGGGGNDSDSNSSVGQLFGPGASRDTPSFLGKRDRRPPGLFTAPDDTPSTKKPEKASTSSDTSRQRRKYTKSGIYSKCPVKAAQARATVRGSDTDTAGMLYLAPFCYPMSSTHTHTNTHTHHSSLSIAPLMPMLSPKHLKMLRACRSLCASSCGRQWRPQAEQGAQAQDHRAPAQARYC